MKKAVKAIISLIFFIWGIWYIFFNDYYDYDQSGNWFYELLSGSFDVFFRLVALPIIGVAVLVWLERVNKLKDVDAIFGLNKLSTFFKKLPLFVKLVTYILVLYACFSSWIELLF